MQDVKERQDRKQERALLGDEENLITLDEEPRQSARGDSRSSYNEHYGFYQNPEKIIENSDGPIADDVSQFNRSSIQSNYEAFER